MTRASTQFRILASSRIANTRKGRVFAGQEEIVTPSQDRRAQLTQLPCFTDAWTMAFVIVGRGLLMS
jgi:hypothetical protein